MSDRNVVAILLKMRIAQLILFMHCAWIYILTNKGNHVLYTGVTTRISQRLWEHETKQNEGSFTARYNINKLVYYEGFERITDAIKREKYIKGKNRKWKLQLIESMNPQWDDLRDKVAAL